MDLNLLPNNAMTFSENQHGNAVLDKLKVQREKNRCCDVILHVSEGIQHYAHRCVLAACSPFFDSFFKANRTVREQIFIDSGSSEGVLTLLGYMYTGTVIINTKNAAELLTLADKFLLCKLKEYCVEYFQRYLDTQNCIRIWNMSNKYGLESLQKSTSSHISIHLKDVLEGEEVLSLSQKKLENFIKNSDWQISNERILNLITSWVFHSIQERESGFRSLLTWISWKEVNPEVVVYLVQVHRLFSESKKCLCFIMDVLNENGLLCEPEFNKIADLRCSENEKMEIEEDNANFMNIAISTAITESSVEYLMDSRKDPLKVDLSITEQPHYEFRDTGHSNIADPSTESCNGNRNKIGSQIKCESNFHSVSGTIPPIDLEELYKYTLENTQKPRQYVNETCDIDRVSPALKECDYDKYSYNDNQANCFHYKEFREGEHFRAQNKSIPKFTNKISYMNHKYDLNHSNELAFGDSNPKNSTAALEFNSPPYQLDFSKDGALNLISGNYSDDHLGIHLNQDQQYHSGEALSPGCYKEDHFTVTAEDIVSDVKGTNSLTDQSVNLNSAAYVKTNAFISSQPSFLYMDCSNDTQSSNNYPKDMSLPHLKLSECHNSESFYQHIDNTYTDINASEMQTIDESVIESQECSNKFDNPHHQSYDPTFDESRQQTLCSFESKTNEVDDKQRNVDRQSPIVDQEFIGKNPEMNDLFDKPVIKANAETIDGSNWDESLPTKGTERNRKRGGKKCVKNSSTGKQVKKIETYEAKKVVKTCEICNATFDRKKDYFGHVVQQHFPGPPFKCDSCKSEFKRIYHLLDHRLIHEDKKLFQCEQCPFSTNKRFNLKEHMTTVHTMNKPFKCEECGVSFSRKQHLATHKTKHTNDRPLICETCGWSAKTRNSLLTHSKIHTGDLYTCQYPDCPYRTAKKSHLKEHMQFHTKSKPFACEICGVTFSSKSHVVRHLSKHRPNLFQCDSCDYCGSRLDALKIHIKRRHSTTKPELRLRKGQLKKKDALFSNKKTEIPPVTEQTFMPNLNNSNGRLSPTNLPLPLLSHYHSPSHSPFGDPDDPLTIVSEMEDNQSPYLHSNIGQAFSGLLDSSCGGDRFPLANDDYYH